MPIALPKVLVAADDPHDRRACCATLQTLHGELIETDADGFAGVAREHDPALIVLQVTSLGVSRIEAALGDEQSRTWDAPVLLVVPPGTDDETLLRAYRAGAADCLVARTGLEDALRRKAEVFLHLQRQRAELQFTVERLALENRRLVATNEGYREQYEVLRRLAAQGTRLSGSSESATAG